MEKINWITEKRLVRDLIPFDKNPRKMSKDQANQLMASLEKFNYVELIAVNQDNIVLAGHMRIAAMKKLGWGKKQIEVRVPDRLLLPEEVSEYCIRSNKNTGEWDWDILTSDWDFCDLLQWGFDMEDLEDKILEEVPSKEEEKLCTECGQKIRKKNGKLHPKI